MNVRYWYDPADGKMHAELIPDSELFVSESATDSFATTALLKLAADMQWAWRWDYYLTTMRIMRDAPAYAHNAAMLRLAMEANDD